MFSTLKKLLEYRKLEQLDKKLQKLTAKRQALKAEAKIVQGKFEKLYLELQQSSGAVKIGPVR